MAGEYPGKTIEFSRCDEKGKIVEHRDAIQQIHPVLANGNTIY